MSFPRTSLVAIGCLALIALPAIRAEQASSGASTGMEVSLDVQRVLPPSGEDGATPQYLCAATIQRAGGALLLEPKIQTIQGQEASVTSTLESGERVAFKVLIPASNEVTWEVEVTPPAGPPERHRATITLPL